MPWCVDVQDTFFFDSGRKCVAMVTAYYGKNGGKILRRELLPQFFTNSHEIWHRCCAIGGVDVQDTFSVTVAESVCHVVITLWQKWGEIFVTNYFLSFSTNSMKFDMARCLPLS